MRELIVLGVAAWLAGVAVLIAVAIMVHTVHGVLRLPGKAWAKVRRPAH